MSADLKDLKKPNKLGNYKAKIITKKMSLSGLTG